MMRKLLGGWILGSLSIAGAVAACNASSTSSATTSGSGGASSGGPSNGSGQATSSGVDFDACFACGDQACASEANACNSACRGLLDCVFGCEAGDSNCQLDCVPENGQPEAQAAVAYYACTMQKCVNECVPQANTPAVTSSSSSVTNAANTASVETSATSTTSVAGTTGAASTTGSVTPMTGINWLSLDGSWADPAAGVNGALNISGAVYAYGDACASVNWDPDTRCVSGTLCEPGSDFANWGMAVAFDFHNTGESGTPPDTKMAWDANAVGAVGVAWQVSGTAPGLQVWVTNMDPSWNGQCSADECAIDGPPDGKTTTVLGAPDQMLFSSMVKDDWGGAGTSYSFSSSSILTLQFKLASVVSGATAFDFCIDQIGIVR